MRTLNEPVRLEKHGDTPPFPRVHVQHTRHQGLIELFGADPLTSFVERGSAEGWPLHTIDAGHDAQITDAEAVVDVLARYG